MIIVARIILFVLLLLFVNNAHASSDLKIDVIPELWHAYWWANTDFGLKEKPLVNYSIAPSLIAGSQLGLSKADIKFLLRFFIGENDLKDVVASLILPTFVIDDMSVEITTRKGQRHGTVSQTQGTQIINSGDKSTILTYQNQTMAFQAKWRETAIALFYADSQGLISKAGFKYLHREQQIPLAIAKYTGVVNTSNYQYIARNVTLYDAQMNSNIGLIIGEMQIAYWKANASFGFGTTQILIPGQQEEYISTALLESEIQYSVPTRLTQIEAGIRGGIEAIIRAPQTRQDYLAGINTYYLGPFIRCRF